MVAFRALGWLMLAMAVGVIVHDGLAWWSEGSFHLLGLGELWSHLDMRSMADAQAAVQRQSSALWTWLIRPMLTIPALAAFLVLGVLFLRLGGRGGGGGRTEPGLLGGARPPRRRRSRGLS